ncbi:MAG: glycosyltransferase family 4 protein [Gemmatimonadetes bacterium]|nr:glycosyltransferase family 4 protein [Gemmatimonadota bacterium]
MSASAVLSAAEAPHAAAGGRCVFIANRLPWPLADGWARRTFHVLEALAAEWPTHFIAYHAGTDAERERDRAACEAAFEGRVTVEALPRPSHRLLRGVLGSLVRNQPLHIPVNTSAAFAAAVDRAMAAGPVSVWGCAGVYMAHYMPPARPGLVRLIDTHNIESLAVARQARFTTQALRRWFTTRTAGQLEVFERSAFADSDLVVVCSQDEVPIAQARAPQCAATMIANGVDLARFDGVRTPHPNSLLFFGRLDYFPNVDAVRFFTESIAAPLAARVPGVRLRIVGAGDTTAVRALAAPFPWIEVVGEAPDIVTELLHAAAVVVPLRVGGGTRLKILEALATRAPIVSTTIGAEGIAARDDVELLLRDTPDAFVDATARLLAQPEESARLGAAARALAEAHYSWDAIGEALRARVRTAGAGAGRVST